MKQGKNWKKRIIYLSLFIVGLLIAFFSIAPVQVEQMSNKVLQPPPYSVSDAARALHNKLLICDLHADSLLWDRNLAKRGVRGHVDIPRLIEGNVALQGFTVVTKSPRKMNIENNDDKSDNIALLALAERWPISTWSSLTARALYQAQKLHDVATASNNKFVIIKSSEDLKQYLARRTQETGITAGFLGIEGAHALDGDINNVDKLYDAGFRMMSPSHFFDNEIGGSAHGIKKTGLTGLGKEMIKRMEAKHMIVDLAHASAQTIDDVLAIATRPIVVSHTGIKGTCANNRNLTDDQVRAIAKTGGIIGIGYWDTAVCGTDVKAIVRAIRYTADLVGVEHVGLGSDFDGAVTTPFDTTGLAKITEALMANGFSEKEIEMIMGGNELRLLQQLLP